MNTIEQDKDYSTKIAKRLKFLRESNNYTVMEFIQKLEELSIFLKCNKCGRRIPRLKSSKLPRKCSSRNCDGRLIQNDINFDTDTIYKWEIGRPGGGNNIGVEYFPMIAKIYKFKSVNGWLPSR